MSSYELATRTGISPTRIREHERAEIDGSIRLRDLERVARGLNCSLSYLLVPNEPLELMVRRQAGVKAAEAIANRWEYKEIEDPEFRQLAMRLQLEPMTLQFMDRRGLWR